MGDVKAIYLATHLKSKEDYLIELHSLHQELGIAIETDTLIVDDLKMLTRMDEIVVILEYLKRVETAQQQRKNGVKNRKKYFKTKKI